MRLVATISGIRGPLPRGGSGANPEKIPGRGKLAGNAIDKQRSPTAPPGPTPERGFDFLGCAS
jgi:hypothetical protein